MKATTGEVLEPQDRLTDLDLGPLEAEQHRPADHHLGELRLRRRRRRGFPDDGPAAEHRDAIRDLEHLIELVADEHDGLPVRPEPAEVLEEVARLRRGQDGRRLVQDQDLDASVEGFQDLDALLLADREVFHGRVRIDLEPVRVGELLHLSLGLVVLEDRTALVAEDHVLGDGERVHQHEVLVDHPDPPRDGIARGVDAHLLTTDHDPARIGRIHAVEDPHQGGLARPVLSDQRVHLARAKLQRDVVIRDDPGEPLRDPLEDDEGRGAFAPRPSDIAHRRRSSPRPVTASPEP